MDLRQQTMSDRVSRRHAGAVLAIVTASGIAIWAQPVLAQHRLVALPLNDPAYVQLEALDRSGCGVARVSPYRPYLVGLIRSALDSAVRDARCAGALLDDLRARFGVPDSSTQERLRTGAAITIAGTGLSRGEFRPLWNDVRPTSEGSPPGTVTARGRATFEGGPRLVAVAEVIAGSHRRGETTIRQRSFRNTSGYIDASDAYLTGQLGPVVFSFGRMPEAWYGDDRESVILSANGPPLDRLLLEAHWRRAEVRGFMASLDEVLLTDAQDSIGTGIAAQRWFRYLVGHAVTWRPRPALEFTLGETAVLTRGARTFDLAYMNPIIPFIFTGNDSVRQSADNRDNLAVFGATQLRLGPAKVRGELLVDELQVDAADRDSFADRFAWRVRGTVPVPLRLPAIVGAEYRRIGTYTYVRGFYSEAYQQFGRPLGSELGPDSDMLRGLAELWLAGKVRVSGSAGLWRHGAIRLDRRPGLKLLSNGYKTGSFPSSRPERPVVQRALLADAAVQFLDVHLPITIRIEAANITNVNNQPSPAALYVRTQLTGTYAFRYP
jgi:capsule assembly protein Wzi